MKFSFSSFSTLKKEGRRKKAGVYVIYHSNMSLLVIVLEWKIRTKDNFKAIKKKNNKQTYKYTVHTNQRNTCFISVPLHPLILQ